MSESKRFELLANIMRASHFEWRRAVASLCPDLDSTEAVKRYWEEVGKDTAAFYLKKIDAKIKEIDSEISSCAVREST